MKITFFTALLLVFIALKLTNHIDWSWWWVLAPAWAPWAVVLVLAMFIGLCNIGLRLLETPEERKRRELRSAFDAYRDRLTGR